MSGTIKIVTFSGMFNAFKSHPSSTITTIAPFSIALSTYLCPSVENPFIATNIYPSFTSFEFFSIPFISKSTFPFALIPSNPTNIFFNSI